MTPLPNPPHLAQLHRRELRGHGPQLEAVARAHQPPHKRRHGLSRVPLTRAQLTQLRGRRGAGVGGAAWSACTSMVRDMEVQVRSGRHHIYQRPNLPQTPHPPLLAMLAHHVQCTLCTIPLIMRTISVV